MWKKLKKFLLIIIIIGLGVAVAIILIKNRPEPEQREQTFEGRFVQVSEARLVDVSMKVEAFGTVRAKRRVTKTAEVSGEVVKISPSLEEGMYFNKGDILLEIDRRSYDLRVKQAENSILRTRAEIDRLRQELENNRINLNLAEKSLEIAEKELERQQKLFRNNTSSEAAVDKARSAFLQEKTRLQSIKNGIAGLKKQMAATEIQLDANRIQMEEAQLALSKTRILAPFNGRIANKRVEQGQFVAAGTPLFDIYATGIMETSARISLEDLSWIDADPVMESMTSSADSEEKYAFSEVTGYVDTGKGQIIRKGNLIRIGAVINESTRTIPVFAEFPGNESPPNQPLLPGMFMKISIKGKKYNDVFDLPRSAIRPDSTVYIASNGLLKIRKVHVLRTMENRAYIDEGLDPGDKIITSPLSAVTDSMKIRIEESTEVDKPE